MRWSIWQLSRKPNYCVPIEDKFTANIQSCRRLPGARGAWTFEGVIVAILAIGVMNHGPSAVECPNREVASWDFRGTANKSSSPLSRNQLDDLYSTTVHVR